ncbi:RiPP maturation radical SAM C-methyltransferase [Streptomyces sp. NPDC052396]|uniref:RiPP maturation radical SAM C-methyltransferase n=1 Tax=Streptomyces sp. NPDC052396 TaxID=3365689 RepID=UPI0037CDBCC5
MLKVALVNMPFGDWNRPSFALSQLKSLLDREFPGEIRTEVHYPNLDFVRYFGPDLYDSLAGGLDHLLSGLGEWLFRQVAFPELPDNTEDYFQRYYRGRRWREFRDRIVELRTTLPEHCAQLAGRYDLAGADVVGFTSMFAQNLPSMAMARLVKERSPGTLTVMGGANCEAPMGTVIAAEVPAVDYVFSGPALHTFPDFLRCLLDGEPDRAHTLPGVITRRNHTQARYGLAVGRDRDIDDFFPPDFHSFVTAFSAERALLDGPAAATEPVLPFETSRGCWWGQRSHCTFCGLNGLGMGYRSMSPKTALRQFEALFAHAPWCTSFACTDNIMPKSFPKEVFAELRPPAGASLFYEIKLPIAEQDLRTMAAAGVSRVQPGVEALSTTTLSLMRKGTTAFLNLQFLRNCLRHALTPEWNLLMGFPGEPAEVYEKYADDLPLLAHLPPPTGAHLVRFDRFSPYHTQPEEYGLDLRPLPFYGMLYPFDEPALERVAYFFADHNRSPAALNAVRWLGPLNQTIADWRQRWREERPVLTLRGDRVYDTRWGEDRPFTVDAVGERLLRRLLSPARPDRLARELGLTAGDVDGRLAEFDGRRVLFREGGQVLSLVSV